MTYDEFRAILKSKNLGRLYLFTGEEDFLSAFCLSEAKKALTDAAFEDFNCKCYGELPNVEDVDTFVNALPLMSNVKLVIFNNCKLFSNALPQKSKWEALFKAIPNYCVCIIRENISEKGKKGTSVERTVRAEAEIVNFDFLPVPRLKPWLVKIAASKGKKLSERDAAYVVDCLGQSMTLLKSEADKMAARAEADVITRADIDSVIRSNVDETVFNLIDAVIYSRRDLAFDIFKTLLKDGTDPSALIAVFASQVLNIYKAKLMMTQKMSIAEIKKTISRNPYAADKIVQKASKTTPEKLEGLIAMLTEAEYKIKNGLTDAGCAFDLIIAN